ncbi:MFS transporter [Aquabacterium humicola]|uniref:MFS transporter n=1 Tax=Aquabacterium humicola TaxID=3237377 RepID=UPI0032F03F58
MFSQGSLNEGVRKREVFGWAMYHFATAGYTAFLPAICSAYFVGVVDGRAAKSLGSLAAALTLAGLFVMLTMPAVGAYADLRAAKKRLLALSTVGCVAATASLAAAGPGDLLLTIAAIVLSNIFLCYGESLIAAFLPELARRDAIGRVSGWGCSLGYVGGLLTLGPGWVLAAQASGEAAAQFVPVTMLITAAVFAVASLTTLVLLKERAIPQPCAFQTEGLEASLRRLQQTFHAARRYRDFGWLLASAGACQAGISMIVTLAAVHARELGYEQADTMTLYFLMTAGAAVGALLLGHWQDRGGHRRALAATLLGLIVTAVLAAVATSATLFLGAAVMAGLCMGSSQSAGRAMVGLLAPPSRRAEFYGLWTFGVRLSGLIFGPLISGLITWMDGHDRLAFVSTGLFFMLGLWLLWHVDMARGERAAAETMVVEREREGGPDAHGSYGPTATSAEHGRTVEAPIRSISWGVFFFLFAVSVFALEVFVWIQRGFKGAQVGSMVLVPCLVYYGRRLVARPAFQVALEDPRAPVIYLRSFSQEGQEAAQDGSPGYVRAESRLVPGLERVGPVLAIGRPGERLTVPGAARLYVGHDDWQQLARSLMRQASLVVIRADARQVGPGLAWEMAAAHEAVPAERLAIWLPGRPDAQQFDKLRALVQEATGCELQPAPAKGGFLRFGVLGRTHWTASLDDVPAVRRAAASGQGPLASSPLRSLLSELRAREVKPPGFELHRWVWLIVLPWLVAVVGGGLWFSTQTGSPVLLQAALLEATFVAFLALGLAFDCYVKWPHKRFGSSLIVAALLVAHAAWYIMRVWPGLG